MKELLWKALAKVVSLPWVADAIIARAQKTPFTHIYDADGSLYMGRWWFWNRFQNADGSYNKAGFWPSVRVHHICRADKDRHQHDHPWLARTIILKRGYMERRGVRYCIRGVGGTQKLELGVYHTIDYVPPEGAWTLFFTWEYQGPWGFLVNGQKVPSREYLAGTGAYPEES